MLESGFYTIYFLILISDIYRNSATVNVGSVTEDFCWGNITMVNTNKVIMM